MNNLFKNILGDNKHIVIVLIYYYFSGEQRPKSENNTPKSR